MLSRRQQLPYSRSQRGKGILLAMNVATENLRPPIRNTWNPAVSLLITACWSNDESVRLSLPQIISSLTKIMNGEQRITSAKAAAAGEGPGQVPLHLAPGALWRRVETKPKFINLEDEIGSGAYASVHKCTFQNRVAACKIFRNTTEESAHKEIEIMFALRHPNVIGLYAWFRKDGALTQYGMVIELAKGDLRSLYTNKMGQVYSFEMGLKVITGAAKVSLSWIAPNCSTPTT